MSLADPHYPTHVENLERDLVVGASRCIAENPAKAGAIAQGIKEVLDVLPPSGVNSPGLPSNHASAVLYPAIKAAMEELATLHEGFNDAVNRAFNHLHGAFWSEVPAPVGAPGLRPSSPGTDFLADSKACDLSTDKPCEACQ